MENHEDLKIVDEESPDVLPNLIRYIAANEVADFDSIEKLNELYSQYQPSVSIQSFGPPAQGARENVVKFQKDHPPSQRPPHSISISMPPSPIEAHLKKNKRVLFDSDVGITFNNDLTNPSSISSNASSKKVKFHSQPIPAGAKLFEAVAQGKFPNLTDLPPRSQRIHKLKDKRYNSFKTWSGKLERQLSHLRGRPRQPELPEVNAPKKVEVETLSADRYFDALEGPELDTLRPSEEILLPEDKKWPFLLRYPISSFGICLGVSSQAIMWKTLASSISTKFLHISLNVNLVLWCISLLLFAIVATTYLLKVIFYFEAVRREYYHPIRVNFFFAPWIALLFLAIGVPRAIAENLHASLWYILMAPIFVLELKIYGQWMSGGQRRLSKVANPSNHLSVVGNFVGALLGASMGLKEGPIFFFAVGLAHYTVLFVTLYQRLPTNETLPKELHPVFFLFVAAPSVASMAWANIQGSFDNGARIAYFIALFLYFSLAVRVNFFRGFRFSLAWWAYTFPMTGASIATIKYANEVQSVVTKALSIFLCSAATLTVTALLLTTIIYAFVLKDLFPNDIAIAISDRKPKPRKWYHRRNPSTDNIENYLKFVDSDTNTTTTTTTRETTKENTPEPVIKNHSHCVEIPS